MALIECYECKGKVSSEAKACPHCGLPIEVQILYYDNGQMRELWFLNGRLWDGLYTVWYENGQKKEESYYKDGKEDGPWTCFYENGQKEGEGNFKDGKFDGLHTGWYENGQKWNESIFKDGKLLSAEVWKQNGEKCPVSKIDRGGNGVIVGYKEDGTENYRLTYKDGEEVED